MAADLGQRHTELERLIRGAGLHLVSWPDGWLAQPLTHREDALGLLPRHPVFVQTLGPGDAGELAIRPETARGRLKKIVGPDPLASLVDTSGLFLWLPKGLVDDDFNGAKAAPPTYLSQDSPEELTKQLSLSIDPRPPVPVIMLEFTGNPRLRSQLTDAFHKIIEQEVSPPVETWAFDGNEDSDLLQEQIKLFPGNRAILAVHDINVGPVSGFQEAKRKLEIKLLGYMNRVQKAQSAAKRDDLKFFWTTIVLRNGSHLPFVKYPTPPFDNWHLLSFINSGEDAIPNPQRTSIFRGYLREWAQL
jgi:hypothetical protein